MNRSAAALLSEIVPRAIRLLDRGLIQLIFDLESAYDADLAGDYDELREQLVVVAMRLGIPVRRLYHEEAADPEFSSGAQPCRYCGAGELRAERWSPPVQVQEGAAAVLPASNGWIAVRPANDSSGAETAVFLAGDDDGDGALWDALRWIADAWGVRPSEQA